MNGRLLMLSALLLTLPGCGALTAANTAGPVLDASVPVKPADVAGRTTLDERLSIGATVAYTAASRMGTALAAAGLIDKVAFKRLDNQGYQAVLAVKDAYDAGNARSYSEAIARVNAAVTGIKNLTP